MADPVWNEGSQRWMGTTKSGRWGFVAAPTVKTQAEIVAAAWEARANNELRNWMIIHAPNRTGALLNSALMNLANGIVGSSVYYDPYVQEMEGVNWTNKNTAEHYVTAAYDFIEANGQRWLEEIRGDVTRA